jgi:uncharacterized protein (DUF1697 family)
MPVYLAMLRGINVGGHRKVAMADLQECCGALGLEQVRTYVQSGNLIFKSRQISTDNLSKKIEAVILKKFGFEVAVIARSAEEMCQVRDDNPFLKRGFEPSKLHVTFLSAAPLAAAVKKLEPFAIPPEEFLWRQREIYLYLPNGAGRSKLANAPFERLLAVRVTARNWNTVNNLCEMASACR